MVNNMSQQRFKGEGSSDWMQRQAECVIKVEKSDIDVLTNELLDQGPGPGAWPLAACRGRLVNDVPV